MYEFEASPWLWDAKAAWHFITVPADISDDIEARQARGRRGFGSVAVLVTIGSSTWNTSVFPSTKLGAYVLPLKKQVRVKEGLAIDRLVSVALELVG